MIRNLKTGRFAKSKINPKPFRLEQKKTGWVFSGAGAKILLEIGAAQALSDLVKSKQILPPVCIVGTSSGGITSAFYAADQIEVLRSICLHLKNKDVYTWSLLNAFNEKASLLDNRPLRRLIEDNLDFNAVRDCEFPVIVNVTDKTTWKSKELDLTSLDDKDMVDALMATTSVPVAFPSVGNYMDGGLTDNYPWIDALAQQVDRIILVVSSTTNIKPIKNIIDMVGQLVSIMLFNQLESAQRLLELVHIKNPNIELTELITIEPNFPINIGLLNIDGIGGPEERDKYMKLGYDLTMSTLKSVRG